MNDTPTRFDTDRLRLRPPTMDDASPIYLAYAQDPVVTRYLAWRPHHDIGTLRSFLAGLLSAMATGHRLAWVITERTSDHAIGMVDLHLDAHRVMVGYVLAQPYWGRGYMTEALSPVVTWALSIPTVYRVWAFCDVENRASARVLEKVGMRAEGVLRRWFVHPNISDMPRDCYSYSRVRHDA